MPPFDINSRRSTPEIVQNSASKVANWIIVDILKYLYECYVIITGKLIFIDDCQRSRSPFAILYILSFNWTVAYHSN